MSWNPGQEDEGRLDAWGGPFPQVGIGDLSMRYVPAAAQFVHFDAADYAFADCEVRVGLRPLHIKRFATCKKTDFFPGGCAAVKRFSGSRT